ncbi:FG-GAP repeat domain-containing protein [Verrucomicrobiota bacterium]
MFTLDAGSSSPRSAGILAGKDGAEVKSRILAFLIIGLCNKPFRATAQTNYSWGFSGAEAVPGDYDGDGYADLAIYYELAGTWYIYSPYQDSVLAWNFSWGFSGGEPVAGDFDGDGTADLGVYNQVSGDWYVCSLSRDLVLVWAQNWGAAGMQQTAADYNGDGITDLAVYYSATGDWYIDQVTEPEEVTDLDELAIMYSNAMVDASTALPGEICRELVAITPDNTNLVWKTNSITGTKEVKLASFMSYSTATSYYHTGETTSLKYAVSWITTVPDLRDFCRDYTGTNLCLRLKKLLGIPATSGHDTIVEYWVDPAYLVRPSPDPQITDCEAELYFGTNALYSTVSTNYVNWFQSNIVAADYGMTNGVWGGAVPWTRLGYTYDWAFPTNNVIGLSEFIIPGKVLWDTEGVEVTVDVSLVTNALYYGNQ